MRVTALKLPWAFPPAGRFRASLAWRASRGPVSGNDEPPRIHGDALSIGWAGYASYRIALHPAPVAEATFEQIPESEAAVAFLLSVLPLALPLFGVEPLHASAVRVDGGALLFLGQRGSGKSSVAAAMEALGYGLLADDCAAIDEDLRLWPGPPLLNPRWNDAQQPIVGTYNLKNVRSPLRHSSDPHEVARVLSLEPGGGAALQIRPLRPREALVRILGNVRSPDVFASRRRSRQLRVGAALGSLPGATLTYDPARHTFDDMAEAVAGWSR